MECTKTDILHRTDSANQTKEVSNSLIKLNISHYLQYSWYELSWTRCPFNQSEPGKLWLPAILVFAFYRSDARAYDLRRVYIESAYRYIPIYMV